MYLKSKTNLLSIADWHVSFKYGTGSGRDFPLPVRSTKYLNCINGNILQSASLLKFESIFRQPKHRHGWSSTKK